MCIFHDSSKLLLSVSVLLVIRESIEVNLLGLGSPAKTFSRVNRVPFTEKKNLNSTRNVIQR